MVSSAIWFRSILNLAPAPRMLTLANTGSLVLEVFGPRYWVSFKVSPTCRKRLRTGFQQLPQCERCIADLGTVREQQPLGPRSRARANDARDWRASAVSAAGPNVTLP